MWDRWTDGCSDAWLCKRTRAENENSYWMSQFSLFRCWMNSLPCLFSLHYYYKSLICNQNTWWVCVCGWLGGLDDITHSLDIGVLERRQWRTSPEMQTVLKEVNMHCAAWQVKATWSWHICALPLMSLILTHHLNKEVRAMIKSSHSVNQVARHMFDPALLEVTSSFCYFITGTLSGGAKSPNRNTSFLIFRL